MLGHDPVARSQLITFFLFVFGTPVGMSRSRPWSKRSCSGWPKEKGKQLVSNNHLHYIPMWDRLESLA